MKLEHGTGARGPRGSRFLLGFWILGIAGCGVGGQDFVGDWVRRGNPDETMTISRNGSQFLIEWAGDRAGATYKDGYLEIATALGAVRMTHVKEDDSLIAPALLGQEEFVRASSRVALEQAAERERRDEAERVRLAEERAERERAAAARKAEVAKRQAERQAEMELQDLVQRGREALGRLAFGEALALFSEAADRQYAPAENELAWLLATAADENLLDGPRAVRYALRAVERAPGEWTYHDTLAAAYARTGEFQRAIESQQRAIELIGRLRYHQMVPIEQKRVLKEAEERMALYSQGSPAQQQ